MRLITINKSKPTTTLEFYGCPMHCKYCTHMIREKKDYSVDQVLKTLLDYNAMTIFLGGAEPALQKKELLILIKSLKRAGKEIVLKTTGGDSDFIKEALPYVNKFVLEVKVPLDDPTTLINLTAYNIEQAQAHLENMRRVIELIKGKEVTATLRIIPGRYDEQSVERIGIDLKDVATEMHLTQFLSSNYDLAFGNISEPSPTEEEMIKLGKALRKNIQNVRVKGNGFDHRL
ncbi:MAG: radical SAM protein [Methanomassiliicoccales archaeon]